MAKTFTVRISEAAPTVTSEQVGQWLDKYSDSRDLSPDPGPGDKSLRLSLDGDRVKECAEAAGETEAGFLRRLIGSNVDITEQGKKHEPEAKPTSPVLKGTFKLRQEQIRPLVSVVDAGQSFLLRKLPPEPEVLRAAAYSEVEKDQLAAASVELVNRRAPKVLVENADIAAVLSTLLSIELGKIERLRSLAERYHSGQQMSPPASVMTDAETGGIGVGVQ
jgi:hypothetical protein